MEAFFSCDPPSEACEWHLAVRDFTKEYNRLKETDYVLDTCFDRKAGEHPIPEVRLTAKSGRPMVVERKRIIWPEGLLEGHSNWHKLAEYLCSALNDFFEYPCSISISSQHLVRLPNTGIQKIGGTIVEQIKGGTRKGFVRCGAQGDMPWQVAKGAYGAPKGRSIEIADWSPRFDNNLWKDSEAFSKVREKIIKGFRNQIDKHLKNIEKKFSPFSNHVRVLLLQFIGNDTALNVLNEETDLPEILQVMEHIQYVDEVWIATEEGISADNSQILWIPFLPRSPVT